MEQESIEKAVAFIETHLTEEWSLETLAREAGYSPYHFARLFRKATGRSVMEYVRDKRIDAAAERLRQGKTVMETTLSVGFDTHAGFTKAFGNRVGCPPSAYAAHIGRTRKKERVRMDGNNIVIRPVCRDALQDLWVHVYSAMTPRQITENVILPAVEKEKRREGIHLVAQVDGRVVMSLPMDKPYWIPAGFLFDNRFVLTGGDGDRLMERLLEEMRRQCRRMGVSILISPQETGSDGCAAFRHFGFEEGGQADGWTYLVLPV